MEHTRTGPPQRLADELEQFARDRDSHGKHARAQAAREAAAALLRGETVEFERVVYIPAGYADRNTAFEGTCVEVIADLDAAGLGWLHLGDVALARQAAAAIAAVEGGATVARVGHLLWRVRNTVYVSE